MPRKSIKVPKMFPSGEKIPLRLQKQLKTELKKIRKRNGA